VETGEPRVINDLLAYLQEKPDSESTQKIVAEGIRSSLTCPLIANGNAIGFIFFSSIEKNAYRDIHTDMFTRIAGQLSVIIEKGRLTSNLAQQNLELHHLVELKNKFLGIAAHDVRHPLGYIQMASQLLLAEAKNPTGIDTSEFLETIYSQAQHATNLLDNLLSISAFDAKGSFLKKEPVEVIGLVTDAVSHQVQIATVKDTHIHLDKVSPVTIYVDPKWLLQVMENLISNAVKFSPSGSDIRISTKVADKHWYFKVQDQGPGITKEDRENLFQDFARLSAKPTGGEKSTGLGLSIARRVVEAHEGTIGVDNVPEGGAIFWFTIPI
jgi:signal transduction histidine kinase